MSEVYFAGSRVENFREWWLPEESLIAKLEKVFYSAHLDEVVRKGVRTGIKLHMGEPGDVHYLRPIYAAKLVDTVRKLKAKPIVVETTGLGWLPGRTSAEKHLKAARRNGFSRTTIGAPILIADGPNGLEGIRRGKVFVARGIAELDAMLVLSHTTGHIQAGYGGAIKNLGLGCVAKTSKFRVHYKGKPLIDAEKCDACGECLRYCPAEAISNFKITEKCLSCNVCVEVCSRGAIKVRATSSEELSRRIAENAAAVAKTLGKENLGYINLAVDVLPHCDCHPHSDIPIVPDLGVLASLDAVAIDRASVDLINAAPGILTSELEKVGALERGADKFKLLHPHVDWRTQLRAAEKLGMGKQRYVLRKI